MLLDANLLLYAVHERAEQHKPAAAWMTDQLDGASRVGFPWQSINAFLRISTHPRAFERPLDPGSAWERVTDWLAAPAIEHGVTLASPDTDFARFPGLRWLDPLTE